MYGCLVVGWSGSEPRVRRQYLCQSAVLLTGLSVLSLTTVEVMLNTSVVLYLSHSVSSSTTLQIMYSDSARELHFSQSLCTISLTTLEVCKVPLFTGSLYSGNVKYLCQSVVLLNGLLVLSLTTLKVM